MNSLKYQNENDKCHGIAGMILSLVANDSEEVLAGVDIDNQDDITGPVLFARQFYFHGNPALSAKIAWSQLLTQYRLLSEMMVSNVMCRCYVAHHQGLSPQEVDLLRQAVREQGADRCQLDPDECDTMLDRALRHYDRIYSSRQIHIAVTNFVNTLSSRRHLSPLEALEILQQL